MTFAWAKPDLRLDNIRGRLTPVLDLHIQVEEAEQKDSPFFLKCDAIQNKLLRIRKEIDKLKSKRDKLPEGSSEVVDVYPHDENARRITIVDYLKEKIAELEDVCGDKKM